MDQGSRPVFDPDATGLHHFLALLSEANEVVGSPFAGVAYDLWVALGPTEGDREIMRRRDLKHMFLEDTLMGIRRGVRGPVWDVSLFARSWGFSLRDIRIPIRLWHGDADAIVDEHELAMALAGLPSVAA